MKSHTVNRPVIGLCLMALVLEGYDVLVFGTVVPSLLSYQPWGLAPADIGWLGSITGIGTLLGALTAAGVADRWGRRRTLIAAVFVFSVAMAVSAAAPTVAIFAVGRLAVGFGAGVLMPTAASCLVEFSTTARRNRSVAAGFVGVSVGGILAALLSIWLIPTFGFRAMFLTGMVPALVLLPLLTRYLPESPAYLTTRGRITEAATVAARYGVEISTLTQPSEKERVGVAALFAQKRASMTLMFWALALLSLLVLFGVATWLPALMKSAGYSLGTALSFLLILNIGGAVGTLTGGWFADRIGIKPMTAAGFGLAAVSLMLLATAPPTAVSYILVLIAGAGTTGTQIMLNAFIASRYPVQCRTTGLGMALGVGRIGAIVGPSYGALFVGFGSGFGWQLTAFAIPAALGVVLSIAVPRAAGPSGDPDSTAAASLRISGR